MLFRSPWALLASAGLGSAALTALAALSGGELGNFGRLGVDLPVFALAVFAWLAIPGYAGLLFARTFVISFPTPLMRHPDALFDPDDADYDEGYYPDESVRSPADRALPAGRLPELPGDTATDPAGRYADLLDHPHAESPGPEQPLEAEVVEEQPHRSGRDRLAAAAEAAPEIVDAEVVESDGSDGEVGDSR